jgi:hypothetical protein
LSLKAPLGISGKSLQRLIDCTKEQRQGLFFIAQDNRVKIMGQGKDQVKVSAGQKLCLAVVKPLLLGHGLALGTMPVTAGVIGYPLEATCIKAFDMTAENRSPAFFNMTHDFELFAGLRLILPVIHSVEAKDVGNFYLLIL